MRKFIAITLVALTTAFAAQTAIGQVRAPTYAPTAKAPRVQPKIPLIPPSAALRAAMRAIPNAKPLGAPRVRGGMYVVKLKQGGRIIKLNVNAATGAVARLP